MNNLGIKTVLILGILGIGIQGVTWAGGCYMPRVAKAGTAQTKSAVYMRSMPCMEEGGTITTAKSQETLTILQESDGRYQLQRSDGTIGWIYTTWLININAYDPAPPAPQTPSVSSSIKKILDPWLSKIKSTYTDQQINDLIAKVELLMKQKSSFKTIGTYIIWKLEG